MTKRNNLKITTKKMIQSKLKRIFKQHMIRLELAPADQLTGGEIFGFEFSIKAPVGDVCKKHIPKMISDIKADHPDAQYVQAAVEVEYNLKSAIPTTADDDLSDTDTPDKNNSIDINNSSYVVGIFYKVMEV